MTPVPHSEAAPAPRVRHDRGRGRLMNLIIGSAVTGGLAGALFALGVLATDGASIGSLIANDQDWLAAAILWLFGIVAGFSVFAITTAIMTLGDEVETPPARPLRVPAGQRVQARR